MTPKHNFRSIKDETFGAIPPPNPYGGLGEPLRYFLHPLEIGLMGDTPEAQRLRKALKADSGADVAAAMLMVRMAAHQASAGFSGGGGSNDSPAEK